MSNPIIIRNIDPDFQQANHHWFDHTPYITHMINSLSFQFPSGEESFVKSVQHFKHEIDDSDLKKAVRAFTGQENLHRKVHQDFNNWIAQQIPRARSYCEIIADRADRRYQLLERKRPIQNLAVTVALEHITAIFASTLLRRPDIIDRMAPEVRPLLVWHAIEEIEHKDVAFDVYQAVGGGYFRRAFALLAATIVLVIQTLTYNFKLLRDDGELLNFRAAAGALNQYFGTKGFFSSMVKSYVRYFLPSFHPSQDHDQELLDLWIEKLATMTPVRIHGRIDRTDQLTEPQDDIA
jgi:predicted metal-dependent hydrolase